MYHEEREREREREMEREGFLNILAIVLRARPPNTLHATCVALQTEREREIVTRRRRGPAIGRRGVFVRVLLCHVHIKI